MLETLPGEVVEYILCSSCLSHNDICRVRHVSTKLRNVCDSNELWKIKIEQRWPGLVSRYLKNRTYYWEEEFKNKLRCSNIVQKQISQMSALYFKEEEVSRDAFAEITAEMRNSVQGYTNVTDELMNILHFGNKFSRLTHKYYAEKAVRCVQQIHLQIEWEQFLKLPCEYQSLEKGSVLLARWCQPTTDITEVCISSQLDEIAKMVKDEVASNWKDHPVLTARLIGYEELLPRSLWMPKQCGVILKSLGVVLFLKLGFHGDNHSYYTAENSFINMVLERKTGIPITLCVIYSAIARRLGVVCEPVGFPAHFLLRWNEHPELAENMQYTYIDVFNGGKFLSREQCLKLVPSQFSIDSSAYEPVTNVKVLERMVQNLVEVGRRLGTMGDGLLCLRNALELRIILCPDDVDSRLLLARVYLHLNINLSDVMVGLQEISARDPTQTGVVAYMYQTCLSQMESQQKQRREGIKDSVEVHLRPKDCSVEFAIGMVMRHKRQFNYSCVISGWDPQCAASKEWMLQMGVHNLPNREFQPFYSVLVEDGSKRYAAQENLEVSPDPKFIHHPEVGRYFAEFCGSYFAPNAEANKEYPEDYIVRELFVRKFYNKQHQVS